MSADKKLVVQILAAGCECLAGKLLCVHSSALCQILLFIEGQYPSGSPGDSNDGVACTSKPCSWYGPVEALEWDYPGCLTCIENIRFVNDSKPGMFGKGVHARAKKSSGEPNCLVRAPLLSLCAAY